MVNYTHTALNSLSFQVLRRRRRPIIKMHMKSTTRLRNGKAEAIAFLIFKS